MTPTVLVDLYGTLVEPDWAVLTAGRNVIADRLGVPPEAAQLAWAATHEARMRGDYGSLERDLAAVHAAACPGEAEPISERLLSALATVERANWCAGVRSYDDVVPMLARLRQAGARLAIITNASAEAAGVIPALGLDTLVDAVFASCTARALKPDLLGLALSELRVRPVECVLLDDDPGQVAAARRMGMSGILVCRSDAARTRITHAVGGPVVTDLSQVPDLVLGAVAAPHG